MPPPGTRRAFVLSELIALLPLTRPPAARPRNPPTHIMAQSARRALVALFALLLLGGFPQSAWPQQPRIHYVYDDLGRLVGVVDQDGNAATYTYDAVGNILAIGRHDALPRRSRTVERRSAGTWEGTRSIGSEVPDRSRR